MSDNSENPASELLDRLIANKVISGTDAKGVLDDALTTLGTLGNITSAPGAIRIVGDVRSQLAKHGVR